MKRSHSVIAGIFIVILTVGVGISGISGIEILQIRSSSGTQYLPELDSSIKPVPVANIVQPKIGDVIGSLTIPRIKSVIAIIEGTGEKELKRGVGHYVGSVLPGVSDNSVLAGHRDSVFRHLGEVKIGDLITVKNRYGSFVYEVHKIRIVKANDRTVIVPSDEALLTLSTCYPFYFVGNAPKRYIVQAGLVIGEPIA